MVWNKFRKMSPMLYKNHNPTVFTTFPTNFQITKIRVLITKISEISGIAVIHNFYL